VLSILFTLLNWAFWYPVFKLPGGELARALFESAFALFETTKAITMLQLLKVYKIQSLIEGFFYECSSDPFITNAGTRSYRYYSLGF